MKKQLIFCFVLASTMTLGDVLNHPYWMTEENTKGIPEVILQGYLYHQNKTREVREKQNGSRIEEEERKEWCAIPSPTIQVLQESLRHVHITLPSVQTRRRTTLIREHREGALVQRRIEHGCAREEAYIVAVLLHRGEEYRRDGLSAEVPPIDTRQPIEHGEYARPRSIAATVMVEEAGGTFREIIYVRGAERIHRRSTPSVERDDDQILAGLRIRQRILRITIALTQVIRGNSSRLHLDTESGEQRIRIERDASGEIPVQKDQLAIVLGERHGMPALNEANHQTEDNDQRVDDYVRYLIRQAESQFEQQDLHRKQKDQGTPHHEILGNRKLEHLRRPRSEHLLQDVRIDMEAIKREDVRIHRKDDQEKRCHE